MSDHQDGQRWVRHSRMSDPAHHAAAIADLPADIDRLTGLIGGLLVHSDWLSEYGVDESQGGAASRATLPIADRLDQLIRRDSQALHLARSPGLRSVGTCRDFALMLCSFLRCKGIPARLRCGFAAYLGGGWEDHWVCEYWHDESQQWRVSDAQIDRVLIRKYTITFDPADVPRSSFMTAGQAWGGYRAGKYDPDDFGHGETTGRWFIKVNVLRDHYVLNNQEVSAWDTWRAAAPAERVVGEGDIAVLDDIAAHPAQPLIEIAPDWYA